MRTLAEPAVELVSRFEIALGPVVEVGQTHAGRRRIVPIVGGRVAGPGLSGTVDPGGADVQVIRADGVTEIEARYAITTLDGHHVFVENIGVRHAEPAVTERLLRGEFVDPSLVYFRTRARFETDADGLRWLERGLFIATGARFPEQVRIDVYRVV